MVRGVLIAALCVGCIQTQSTRCPDGSYCPSATTCVYVTGAAACVSPDQLAACDGKPDYTHCSTNGRCYDGACMPIACGNGRADRPDPNDPNDSGEACDDGNQISGDGCSADCKSNETCGNGALDPIRNELCDDGNLIDHDGCDSRCMPEHPTWTPIVLGPPLARTDFAMAYDSARDRVVVFGGASAMMTFGDTWEWDGHGWSRVATSGPSARTGAAMAYDAKHHQTILFGGKDADFAADTWAWDGATWTPLVPPDEPQARGEHVMAYDSARERIVLFGGDVASANVHAVADTWEWDGSAWSQVATPSSPTAVAGAAMAYDPVRRVMVLFGGKGGGSAVSEYDGTTWRSSTPNGASPSPREAASFAWDASTLGVVLFGGLDITGTFADTWRWDGTTWTPIVSATSPPARSQHHAVTDERGHVVVWGGSDDLDTWELVAGDWRAITQMSPPPQLATAVYDSRRGRGVLVDGGTDPATVWEFSGRSWETIPYTGAGPTPNGGSQIAYDEKRGVTVLFGNNSEPPDDRTWEWDGLSWTPIAAASAPQHRSGEGLAYDVARERVVLFGGEDSTQDLAFDDTWEWDGATWTELHPASSPPACSLPQFAYDPIRKQLVLFGGDGASVGDETWTWDGSTWTHVATTGPSRRAAAAFAWSASRQRLVMFGGSAGASAQTNETWEWDGHAWAPVPAPVPPSPRGAVAMFPLNDGGLAMFGGSAGFSINFREYGDTAELRWTNDDLDDACRVALDRDGDQRAGCADGDCWQTCTPTCPPGTDCAPTGPHCGDGTCEGLESCRSCPADCTCDAICGDLYCDDVEASTCPGDCP